MVRYRISQRRYDKTLLTALALGYIRHNSLLCRQTVWNCEHDTEITQCSNIFTFDFFGRRRRWLAIVTGKQKMKMKGVTESQWRLIRKAHTSQYYWSLAAPSQIYFVTWTTWSYLFSLLFVSKKKLQLYKQLGFQKLLYCLYFVRVWYNMT